MKREIYEHGMTQTRAYASWEMMKQRCQNPKFHKYHSYGKRGITICTEWEDFRNFYMDMGDRPKGMTLDRIDNDGNYCKENCRWATHSEQQVNKRKRLVEYKGEKKSINEWAKILSIHPTTLWNRVVTYRWSARKAFETPIQKKGKHI